MRLQLTARHGHVDDSVRIFAEQKLAKLDRRLPEGTLVEVTLSREHNPSIADGPAAAIAALTPKFDGSPDARFEVQRTLVDGDLERQVERYRDKRTVEARRRAQHHEPAVPEGLIELDGGETAA